MEFTTNTKPTWCAGCSNFAIRSALLKAFVELGLKPEQIAMVFDIGCAGNSASWYNVYSFHGLHGRVIPVASGMKLANKKLKVIGIGGDGGMYGEGIGHLMQVSRSNIDITIIVSNNQLYSLTTGQASPTTKKGTKTKSTPEGIIEKQLNPLSSAISASASFVARAYTGELSHLTETIKKAINHKGFSLIDVLQPCVTIDKIHNNEWFKSRIEKLDNNWPVQDKKKAFDKAEQLGEKIPIGIIYQKERPAYQSELKYLKNKSLIDNKLKKSSIKAIFKNF
ncbi:thiamine pyrophosphate-dependent enzyme [Patescibacteria group bacterium]